jgi:hypothetical protein
VTTVASAKQTMPAELGEEVVEEEEAVLEVVQATNISVLRSSAPN